MERLGLGRVELAEYLGSPYGGATCTQRRAMVRLPCGRL